MRIHYSVKHWFNIACILVLLPFSNLALSNYTKLDPAAALALIDESGHAEIPNAYTSIGADAFRDSGLNSVTIPDTITSIGNNAFKGNQLTSVIIPDSVLDIGDSAFSENELLSIIIPNYVTEIGNYAFHSNYLLETVTLGDSVETVGYGAFIYTNVKSWVFPNSLTNISSESFSTEWEGFDYLSTESVIFGEDISYIPENLFKNNPLNYLVIGSNVSSIGDDAFNAVNGDVYILKPAHENLDIYDFSSMANVYACDSLDDAGMPQGCETFLNTTASVLKQSDAYALIDENGHAEIPDGYTRIGADAFRNSGLLSVTIPDSITSIGNNAFEYTDLTSVIIPDAVTQIGSNAFFGTSLTSVTIPTSVVEIGDFAFAYLNKNCEWDGENEIEICSGFSELYFAENSALAYIGDNAFRHNTLTSISLPDSLEYIGWEAFYVNNISSLTIGGSITHLERKAFSHNPIEVLVIGDSVTTIGDHEFSGVPISSLILGANVTSIGEDAFNGINGDVYILKPAQENFDIYDFSSMANVYACDSLDDAGTPQGCEQAYPNTPFTKLDPPAALALIDENGHAEIPNTYTSIGADAFVSNSNLKSVTIPDSITSIGNNAFMYTDLTSVIIPDAVTQIGSNAFRRTSLTSVTIPASVVEIGYQAFYKLNQYCDWDEENEIEICSGFSELNFAENSALAYIDSNAFAYNTLTSISLPDSLENIAPDAFYQNNISSLTIGGSITHLEYKAFRDNPIEVLVIGDSVTTIGDEEFKGMPISSLTLGANVTSIGEDAFNGINGDVYILKPAQENLDINDFSGMANVYACDSLDDAGVLQGCFDAWPNDGIDPPVWPPVDPVDPVDSTDPTDYPEQIIAVGNITKGVLGQTVRLDITYDTSDGDNTLPGLGMRIHYNSQLLTFNEVTDIVTQDLIVNAEGPFSDEDDHDNDSSTDQYVSFGWASFYSNWPNTELSAVLMGIAFDVSENIDTNSTASTQINFSEITTTSGYVFSGESYDLELISATWDFDGNGHADALTDGLIMLRYCFDLRGEILVKGVMSPESTMTADQVEDTFENAMDIADIDNDGSVDALTDGLILLRYLFDIRGNNLTQDVMGQNAGRTSHSEIEAHIEKYMPEM